MADLFNERVALLTEIDGIIEHLRRLNELAMASWPVEAPQLRDAEVADVIARGKAAHPIPLLDAYRLGGDDQPTPEAVAHLTFDEGSVTDGKVSRLLAAAIDYLVTCGKQDGVAGDWIVSLRVDRVGRWLLWNRGEIRTITEASSVNAAKEVLRHVSQFTG